MPDMAMAGDWTEPLDPAERDRLIDRVATAIVRRGMEVPAILFLEMHKPISFMASQGAIVLSPMIAPFVGFENMRLAAKVMEDRSNLERLICRIEELVSERGRP